MEEFEKMLEQYLNEEEIKYKISLDKKNDDGTIINKKGTSNNFLSTISISDFVKYYLGTDHDCNNLKHQGLKSFDNPYVVGISNNFATKNPDCIRRQEILVVIDSYGNPGTYINPLLLQNLENMEHCKSILKILNSIRIENLKEIALLYSEYMKIHQKIDELEQKYIDGCDLLNQLQKNSLLREIRKYAKEASKKGLQFVKKQSEILRILASEDKILSQEQSAMLRKEK